MARRGEDLETLQGRGHRWLLLDPWIRADRGDVGEMCRGAMATVAEGSGGLVPLRSGGVEKFEAGCFGCKFSREHLCRKPCEVFEGNIENMFASKRDLRTYKDTIGLQGSTETGDHSFRPCKFQT